MGQKHKWLIGGYMGYITYSLLYGYNSARALIGYWAGIIFL